MVMLYLLGIDDLTNKGLRLWESISWTDLSVQLGIDDLTNKGLRRDDLICPASNNLPSLGIDDLTNKGLRQGLPEGLRVTDPSAWN